MQLRKMVMMLVAVGAASMVLTGCPGGGGGSTTCATSTDCLTSEVCHPDAKVCVQTCTAAADCPDTAKKCEALGGTTADKDKMICKCTTDALCNSGRQTPDQYCAAATGLCTKKCTVDADCGTNGTCETATGACKPKATCTFGSCAAGQVCNPTSKACEAAPTCSGTGKSTCATGQHCSSGKCAEVSVAPTTCSNFASNRPTFDAATSTGPFIYEVSKISYQVNSSYCQAGAPDAFIIRLRAYRTDADWPSTRSELSGFFYVRTDTVRLDVVNSGLLVPNTGYNRNTTNLKDAEFQVYLCRPSNSTALQVGFFFTGGNPVCADIPN